jgi:predicted GH43/DUF377 family glycosyl hydrolase
MWYTGVRGERSLIGLARSPDGMHWTRWQDNPVFAPSAEEWDSVRVDLPRVLYHEGVYRMWYTGFDGFHRRIGYAVSGDGVVWERLSVMGDRHVYEDGQV